MSKPTNRWLALFVLCLGDFMIVLDTTIVNVALPSIQASLGFSQTGLVWVINAYMLTFGGFLLLGGRLGDLFGYRRLFIAGLALFTLASLGCGVSVSEEMLVATRALQGIGGAVVSAVALSLIMNLFTDEAERAKAMGVFGFVMAGGGSVGVFLGGLLTNTLNWHWVFLVNVPIGILVMLLVRMLLPAGNKAIDPHRLDWGGAITITSSLMLAVYGIIKGNEMGWLSAHTLGFIGVAAGLFALFLAIEAKVKAPLMPLHLFKFGNLRTANIIGVLWSAGMFAWFFLSALYMQMVLGYSPLKVGLAFLPANITMALFSLGISAKLVGKFGLKKPIIVGMAFVAIGLGLFAFAPVKGQFWLHIFPAMMCLGLGGGTALNPLLLAAMNGVPEHESGLASGVVNTAFMMGGALGLAILASISAARYEAVLSLGTPVLSALTSGYHWAFVVGAVFAAMASVAAFRIR
ncbi:MAG: DHA2 family efflux MFS transporter permease subunit [Candidatus Margulisiibacteriota bacterium]